MKKKKIYVVICMTLILLGVLGTTALAEVGARRDNIKSHGNIDVQNGTAAIYSSDFIYLADEIDTLENAYKTNTVAALNTMGTYYDSNGAVTHNQDDEGITSEVAVNLTFSQIYNGVLRSQSVDHLSDQQATDGTGSLLYYADEAAKNDNNLVTTTTTANDFPLLIQPITADNLTAGTAAWVNGECIIGNGVDNRAFYNLGYSNGYAKNTNGVKITHTYHTHTSSCGGTCTVTCGITGSHYMTCPSCGATISMTEYGLSHSSCGQASGWDGYAECGCGYKVGNKGHGYSNTYTHQYYNCGMTNNTIISTTIEYLK